MNKNKESRGIYNVTFNEKNATPIYKDIEIIENAVIEYIAMYVKGWHNERRGKGTGAEHIKLHLEKDSNGEISIEELVNIGNSLREYLKIFGEPFKDNETAKIYEWQNDNGVRFRVVTDKIRGEGHSNTPLSPSKDAIITFYSDRNLNERMKFKNPQVENHYENKILKEQEQSLKNQGIKPKSKSTKQKSKSTNYERGI